MQARKADIVHLGCGGKVKKQSKANKLNRIKAERERKTSKISSIKTGTELDPGVKQLVGNTEETLKCFQITELNQCGTSHHRREKQTELNLASINIFILLCNLLNFKQHLVELFSQFLFFLHWERNQEKQVKEEAS